MALQRLPSAEVWELKDLDDYLTACGQMRFEWGKHDCVLFMVAWLKIHTSKDYLEHYPRWDSERSGLRVLKSMGGLESWATQMLGAPIKTPPMDGDIALLPAKLGGLCIVYGAYVVSPAKPTGLGFHPFTDAQRFWRLPCQTTFKKR